MNIIQVGSSGHYEYALAAAKRAGFRFTGICMGDRREKNTTRERFRKFGFEVPLYEDYSEMLEKAPSDIVIINSFMGYNAEFAAEALRRGKLTEPERAAEIAKLEKQMLEASKMLEFEYAAVLRDRIIELRGGNG